MSPVKKRKVVKKKKKKASSVKKQTSAKKPARAKSLVEAPAGFIPLTSTAVFSNLLPGQYFAVNIDFLRFKRGV